MALKDQVLINHVPLHHVLKDQKRIVQVLINQVLIVKALRKQGWWWWWWWWWWC